MLIASFLIGLMVVAGIVALEFRRLNPVPIRFEFVNDSGQLQEDYVADTWQEWQVTYVTGQTESLDSRSFVDPSRVVFDVAKSGEPATIMIEFKVELKRALKSGDDGGKWDGSFPFGHYWFSTPWQEILRGEPLVAVLVDFRPAVAELSLSPLIFTATENKIGDAKVWKAFIVFSGNPSVPSDASVIRVEGSLAGKKSAAVQIVNTQTWFLTQFYYPSKITGDPSPFTNERSRRGVVSPYGLNFMWQQGQAGSTTFSWPTAVISSDTGGIILIHTVTGTSIMTLWKYMNGTQTVLVTATLAGPTMTVTQTIATNRPTGGTDGGSSTGAKGLWPAIVAWLRSLMPAGLEDLWWLLGIALFIVAVVILAFIVKILKWALSGKK